MNTAEKLAPKPTPWRQGLPVKLAMFISGPQWRGIRNAQSVTSNSYSAERHKGVSAYFWQGCLAMESEAAGVVLVPMAQIGHIELDLG